MEISGPRSAIKRRGRPDTYETFQIVLQRFQPAMLRRFLPARRQASVVIKTALRHFASGGENCGKKPNASACPGVPLGLK
jgi:hypothetical protein